MSRTHIEDENIFFFSFQLWKMSVFHPFSRSQPEDFFHFLAADEKFINFFPLFSSITKKNDTTKDEIPSNWKNSLFFLLFLQLHKSIKLNQTGKIASGS